MSPSSPTSVDLRPLTAHPPLVFETEHVRLRAVQLSDAELLFNLYTRDPEICKYVSYESASDVKETRNFIESVVRYRDELSSSGEYSWVIERKDDGTPMGSCGFGPKNHFALEGEYIFHPAFWGTGYVSEAWKCLVDWAKAEPGVYRIEAYHHVDNVASGKVLKNAGMSFEGIMRRGAVFPNLAPEPHDCAIYAWAR